VNIPEVTPRYIYSINVQSNKRKLIMAFKTLPPQPSDVRLLEGVKSGTAVTVKLGLDLVSVLVLRVEKETSLVLRCDDSPNGSKVYSVVRLSHLVTVDKFEGKLTCFAVFGSKEVDVHSRDDLDPKKLYGLSSAIGEDKKISAKYVFSSTLAGDGKIFSMEGSETNFPTKENLPLKFCEVEAYVGME